MQVASSFWKPKRMQLVLQQLKPPAEDLQRAVLGTTGGEKLLGRPAEAATVHRYRCGATPVRAS